MVKDHRVPCSFSSKFYVFVDAGVRNRNETEQNG